jgi:CubicO group peptidase (beta-lactamase class C family)
VTNSKRSERLIVSLKALLVIGLLAIPAALPVAAQAPARRAIDIASVAATALKMPGQGETRVLLVAEKRTVRFHHLAPGYRDDMKFVSWSMAKTVTAMALGMLVDEGRIDIDAPAPVRAWQQATDGRQNITTRHLLSMTSGLKHQEAGERGQPIERADTVRLLFTDAAHDAASYAIARPLEHPPGAHWQYSTATSHILADIVSALITRETAPDKRRAAAARWFAERLWMPLGITSAEWDFDASGLFLGGSMLHMTAHDYLRLGQFMLDRGTTPSGTRLLSERWIDVMLTKAAAANNNHYAGHLWLNTGPAPDQPAVLFHPSGGPRTFAMIGHLGQYVVVAPDANMVIVRLGKSVTAERGAVRAALGSIVDAAIAP